MCESWLASALGQQACRLGMTVSFHRVSDKAALLKPDLLILDDFGIGEMTPLAAQVLYDVAERRIRTGSLLVTSQYPTDKWHSFFPDPTIADAVLDLSLIHI